MTAAAGGLHSQAIESSTTLQVAQIYAEFRADPRMRHVATGWMTVRHSRGALACPEVASAMVASLSLRTSVPRPLALAAASTAVIVVMWWMPGPSALRAPGDASPPHERGGTLSEPRSEAPGSSVTAAITEIA